MTYVSFAKFIITFFFSLPDLYIILLVCGCYERIRTAKLAGNFTGL